MSRARCYVFTVNNYDDEDENQVYALSWELGCRYVCVGREVGESGTRHLQGMVCFKERKSLNQVKAYFPTAHFEEKRGTFKQASDYCKKDGDFFEWGELPMDDDRKGLTGAAAMEALMGDTLECVRAGDYKSIPVAATHFIKAAEYRVMKERQQDRNMETIDGAMEHEWYYGPAGTGKSRKARDENPGAYLKMCNKWWDDYNGEDVVLIEDFDRAHDKLVHHLKVWADRYAFPAEIKGSKINLRPKKIIVTSNYHPKDIWTSDGDLEPILRRFKVTHFGGYNNLVRTNHVGISSSQANAV